MSGIHQIYGPTIRRRTIILLWILFVAGAIAGIGCLFGIDSDLLFFPWIVAFAGLTGIVRAVFNANRHLSKELVNSIIMSILLLIAWWVLPFGLAQFYFGVLWLGTTANYLFTEFLLQNEPEKPIQRFV